MNKKRKKTKRIFVALLTSVLLLSGCEENKSKPEDISEEAYENAVYTIESIDSYLSEKSNLEETIEKLYKLDVKYDSDYYNTLSRNEEDELIDENLEFQRDPMINIEIVDIRIQTSAMDFGDEEYKEKTLKYIKKLRDELAEKINYDD